MALSSSPQVGACDLIYLLSTSLAPGLLAAHEGALLRCYNDALGRELAATATAAPVTASAPATGAAAAAAPDAPPAPPPPPPPPLAALEHEYALATLDFARFVLADGLLVDGLDEWLCLRASQLLSRLDGGGAGASAEKYAAALAATPSVFAGSVLQS